MHMSPALTEVLRFKSRNAIETHRGKMFNFYRECILEVDINTSDIITTLLSYLWHLSSSFHN